MLPTITPKYYAPKCTVQSKDYAHIYPFNQAPSGVSPPTTTRLHYDPLIKPLLYTRSIPNLIL